MKAFTVHYVFKTVRFTDAPVEPKNGSYFRSKCRKYSICWNTF